MSRIRNFTGACLVATVVAVGFGGVATAAPLLTGATTPAPSTSTTAPPTATPSTSTPSTSTPSTSTPSTSTPSTSTPSTTTPTTAPKAKAKKKRKHLLTGTEIWRIVDPHHAIDCGHATKEVARIRVADAAAAKRLAGWETRNTSALRVKATSNGASGSNAAATRATKAQSRRMKKTAGMVRGFQKLENDGQALIKRIDATCSAANAKK